MAEVTGISWCDHTFNPWIGCMKVSPACDNCYAEAWDQRFGGGHWGAGAQRRRTSPQKRPPAICWTGASITNGRNREGLQHELGYGLHPRRLPPRRYSSAQRRRMTPPGHLAWVPRDYGGQGKALFMSKAKLGEFVFHLLLLDGTITGTFVLNRRARHAYVQMVVTLPEGAERALTEATGITLEPVPVLKLA